MRRATPAGAVPAQHGISTLHCQPHFLYQSRGRVGQQGEASLLCGDSRFLPRCTEAMLKMGDPFQNKRRAGYLIQDGRP